MYIEGKKKNVKFYGERFSVINVDGETYIFDKFHININYMICILFMLYSTVFCFCSLYSLCNWMYICRYSFTMVPT